VEVPQGGARDVATAGPLWRSSADVCNTTVCQ